MKKKIYLAILTMCAVLTVSACGAADSEKKENANTEADVQEEKDSEKTGEEKKNTSDSATRLVSVDNVDKYITIGQYKGLSLDNTLEQVTDDDVEAQISQELQDKAEEVTKGTVEDGDITTINYVGTKDGVAFEGGTANNYNLTIGSGMLIPGFEDGIVGMTAGETKDLNLTFPEGYPQEDVAGQDVVFKVTVQSFRRAQELSDEWVKKNTDYENMDAYRTGVKSELEESAKTVAESSLRGTAWTTVLSTSEVKEYPQADVDEAIAEFRSEIEKVAKQGDMEIEEFVESQGLSMDDFDSQSQQYAEYKVKQNLVVQGIMDAEGITLEDKECLDIQDKLIQDYGAKDLAALIDQYGQVAVDESIGVLRIEDFIVANANVQDTVANGEQTGVNADDPEETDGTEAAAGDEAEAGGTVDNGEIDEELEAAAEKEPADEGAEQ